MRHALVAVDGTDDDRELLAEAADYVTGTDADLVLLLTVSPETFANNSETIEQIAEIEHTTYSDDAVRDSVAQPVVETAADVLAGHDYQIITRISENRIDEILDVADEHDCDHLFMRGQARTPTGKALFGDETQQALLNFDGYVTVTLQ